MTATKTKERPILFSAPMVRAILDARKTQTRRPLNPQPEDYGDSPPLGVEWYEPLVVGRDGNERDGPTIFGAYWDEWGIACPYGGPGDLLWVREAFDWVSGTETVWAGGKIIGSRRFDRTVFRADGGNPISGKWTPSIHMPRWVSRITLRVTSVRVERIQDISDVSAEGYPFSSDLDQFKQSWDSTYARRGYGWKDNPWVWVIEFEHLNRGVAAEEGGDVE